MTLTTDEFRALLATAKPGPSFSGDMIRAILAGRKTETRRPMKPQPDPDGYDYVTNDGMGKAPWTPYMVSMKFKPRYQPGGVYYARETWQPLLPPGVTDDNEAEFMRRVNRKTGEGIKVYYPATDGRQEFWDNERDCISTACKPSIHFPRWAARIIYRVDKVFPQRLHDITDEAALAEGVEMPKYDFVMTGPSPRARFRALWQSIYGAESWDANPWLWCYQFQCLAIAGEKESGK